MDKKLNPNLFSLVVVEGGPKAIKCYKKLMLNRIKWDTMQKKVEFLYSIFKLTFLVFKFYKKNFISR